MIFKYITMSNYCKVIGKFRRSMNVYSGQLAGPLIGCSFHLLSKRNFYLFLKPENTQPHWKKKDQNESFNVNGTAQWTVGRWVKIRFEGAFPLHLIKLITFNVNNFLKGSLRITFQYLEKLSRYSILV